jgi:hypothetical protein
MKRLQSSLKGNFLFLLFHLKDVRFMTVAKLQPLFHGSLHANQSLVFKGQRNQSIARNNTLNRKY